MTKNGLIKKIHNNTNKRFNPDLIEAIYTEIFKTIAAEVKKGNPVRVTGVGYFYAKRISARSIHDPNTQELNFYPAHNTIGFKPSPKFKLLVN